MSLLWSFLANDPARVACLLHPVRALLRDDNRPRAFRIGFFQGDEVLLHRRPLEGGEPFELGRAAEGLRTDAIVAATTESAEDDGAVGRFRNWLCGFTGTLPLGEEEQRALRAALSPPLERSLTQASAGQLLFYHFLQTLGLNRLEDPTLTAPQILQVISETLQQLGRRLSGDRLAQARFALSITNGRLLVALRHGVNVTYQRLAVTDCPVCAQRDSTVSATKRAAEHEHLRGVLVAAGDGAPALHGTLGEATALLVSADLATSERLLRR